MALAYLLGQEAALAVDLALVLNPLAPKPPHFPAKAKSVIFVFMQGGPSQVDTFDPKPELTRLDGQPVPASFHLPLAQIKASGAKLMATRRTFRRYGDSGLDISDLFENLANYADDLAVIRSCHHESFIHGPAVNMIHTGFLRLGNPSMGAWILYGLGSETQNLPAYIVRADNFMRNSKAVIGSGFLPATFQGTMLSSEGAPLANLSPPAQVSSDNQRTILDQLKIWNRRFEERNLLV